jgi:hypothetical protein
MLMRILLLSMPDSFEHTPSMAMRFPNGALASIAGNIDSHHDVAIADLVLAQRSIPDTITRLMREKQPDVVGLSVMTFQRKTALQIIRLIRTLKPDVTVVAGGYDPSLATDMYETPSSGVDIIVRGEGDVTTRELMRALESGADLCTVHGISFRRGDTFVRTPDRHVSNLENEVRPPKRAARVLTGYTFLGRQIDVVETSRGCTYDCSFCSIIEMRGRNFHVWPIEHVIADIRDAHSRGARAILPGGRQHHVEPEAVHSPLRSHHRCRAHRHSLHRPGHDVGDRIGRRGAGGADAPCRLQIRVPRHRECAGSGPRVPARAGQERATRGGKTVGSATMRAIEVLHNNGLWVVGGLIVGNPDDTRESIEANLEFARKHVDWPYIQHPDAVSGTPMTVDFRERSLIVNDRVDEYDGTTAVVRTERLTADEIEFMRWRAERWMKVRHLPTVMWHYPRFVALHWPMMLRHNFRGTTWRTWLGLEPEQAAFARYKQLRVRERQYLSA